MKVEWTPWRELVDAVLKASDLPAAQLATSDLVDEALPGGSVQADDASALVAEVRVQSGLLRRSPFRAYILSVLVQLAMWGRTWRIAEATGNRSEPAAVGAVSEQKTDEQLAPLCSELMPLADDDDPEVRSMMYLLAGASGEPEAQIIDMLEHRASDESNELARACAIQGVVKVLARLSENPPASVVSWVNNALERSGDLVYARVHLELESLSRTEADQRRLKELIGVKGRRPVSTKPPSWPAENV